MKITIEDEIFERIKERIKDTDFKSVEKYVNLILREAISKVEERKSTFTKKEEDKIKKRLRALGYVE